MKKNFAAATIALLGAPAFAQSGVSISGAMDAGIVAEGGGPAGSITRLTSGVSTGTRLALRGTEDLGGGNSAYFWLEMGPQLDTGGFSQPNLLWGRQSVVGLRGGWGAVALGRQYTPVAVLQLEMDPFASGYAGTSGNLMSPGGAGGNNRMNNTVKYMLPSGIGGVNGEFAYAFGEVAGDTSASREVGGSIGYEDGPLSVKLAYHNVNDATGKSGRVTWLAGKYGLGFATLHMAVALNKGSRVYGVLNADSTDILIGATIPAPGGRVITSYINKNDKTSLNGDAKQFGIGYDYFLSKRTTIYTAFAKISNNSPIVPGVSGYRVGTTADPGTGNRAFNLGIRQLF